MRINIDCMRAVMVYLEKNLLAFQQEEHPNIVEFTKLSVLDVSNALLEDFDPPTVFYSIRMLWECKYIVCIHTKGREGYLAFTDIDMMTYAGHQFLESIRPESVWIKTKGIISRIGSHSLKFVEDTAQMVAVEMGKQVVVSITKQGAPQ